LERESAEPSFDREGITHRLVNFRAARSKFGLMEVLPDGCPVGRYLVAGSNVSKDESADVRKRSQDAGASRRRFVYGYRHKREVARAHRRVHPRAKPTSSEVAGVRKSEWLLYRNGSLCRALVRLEVAMPHYFFDIQDGHRLVDPAGSDCKDDTAALEKARVLAIGVSLDKPAVDPTRHISVLSADRTEISRVPVYSKPVG
jgi:hypothetical protein